MNINISLNGSKYLCIENDKVFIDNEQINIPKNINLNNQTICDGKIYIGGYEYIDSEKIFKRTLRAIWHMLF